VPPLAGTIISGKVARATKEYLEIPFSYHDQNLVGRLYGAHLTDDLDDAPRLLKQYREHGTFFQEVLVLQYDSANPYIELSIKPSLLNAHKNREIPYTFEQVKLHMILPGYVAKFFDRFVLIKFSTGLQAGVLNKNISDKFIAKPTDALVLGQSVNARVCDISVEKKTFFLTLKQSDAPVNQKHTLWLALREKSKKKRQEYEKQKRNKKDSRNNLNQKKRKKVLEEQQSIASTFVEPRYVKWKAEVLHQQSSKTRKGKNKKAKHS